jgi:hypothetical protein
VKKLCIIVTENSVFLFTESPALLFTDYICVNSDFIFNYFLTFYTLKKSSPSNQNQKLTLPQSSNKITSINSKTEVFRLIVDNVQYIVIVNSDAELQLLSIDNP